MVVVFDFFPSGLIWVAVDFFPSSIIAHEAVTIHDSKKIVWKTFCLASLQFKILISPECSRKIRKVKMLQTNKH